MRARRAVLVLVALVAALAVGVGSAFGYWSSTGTGSGSATTATLNPPTDVLAGSAPGTGSVSVTWTPSAVAANAPAPTGYYVVRHDAADQTAPACASDSTHLVTSDGCTDSLVPVGSYSYTVVAVLSSWTATSTPSPVATVAKADQAITFTSTAPANATYHGATYTVTATGGGSGNAVTFGIDPAAASVCTISNAVVSFIGAGTCVIDADQAGSTYYNAAPQAQQSFAVAKAAQAIAFTSAAPTNAVVGGPGYSPTATGGASGNPVVFTIDATTAGTCSISGGVVTYQHSGSCTVDANQAGDPNYAAANQVQQSFGVGPGAQAINFTSSPTNPTVNGPAYPVAATGGASGNPVTFTIDPAAAAVCSITGTSVSFTAGGTCIIDANQAGNADYLAAAQVQQQFTVAKAAQTITFSSTAPANAAVGGTYTAAATATSGLTVSFSSGSPTICASSGPNGATFTFAAAGTCIVNANQSGNARYSAAPTQTQSFSVTAAINGAALCFVQDGQSGCATSPVTLANGGTFSGVVRLLDSTGTAVKANSTITVSLSHQSGDDLTAPSPVTVTITAGTSDSGKFTIGLSSSGNGKSGVLTATAGQLSASLTLKTAK